ncbi:MAG: hypothetical protein QOD24_4290 [Solirubrobacteraceae bacterium]|nr:hypothetical protein [Solirubrobacteraceae bacterium]
MPKLARFSTPGNVPDHHPDAWSRFVKGVFAQFRGFPQFYDPTRADTPENAVLAKVIWPAFPGDLQAPPAQRFAVADGNRDVQGEYCEWGVDRRAGKITRVTFTSEVPEYYEHLFDHDPKALLNLYRKATGEDVRPGDLEQGGHYNGRNVWNGPATTRPVHLIQGANTLGAAVELAAKATVLREEDGEPVTSKQRLVVCGGLGRPLRNSDPQIAVIVNDAAAKGAEVTLNDPPGLYIDSLITGGMTTPDGTDPRKFWKRERGAPGHTLRARFEVPPELGYTVSDIRIGGRRIQSGGELALRVRVRLEALVKPAKHNEQPQPCEGS